MSHFVVAVFTDGKKTIGQADMAWVESYGSNNIKNVSKVNDSTEQHI